MTKTFKILSAISFIALAIVLTFVGVWALADLDFTVGGNIEYTAPEPEPVTPEDVSYLTFEYDSATMEATLTGYDGKTADVVIPEQIVYNNKTYTVTSMTESYFDGDYYIGVFTSKSALKSLSWPSTMTSIGDSAFSTCTSLASITIPNGVTSIGTSAFASCTSLTSIIIPDGVTSIGDNVFWGCTSITSITIPSSVTSVGGGAFYNCTSLEKVEVKATTPPTGGYVMFAYCPLTTGILVPSASVDLYKSAEYWSGYSDYIKAGSF